ncbi:ATP-binding protein [Streptomyces sp. NPDC058457]|uniref:ATP-binding protein n=1 Tax=Streptomyces sp. NPDC058457 TaxID=3346507 RepID=UPI00364B1EA2
MPAGLPVSVVEVADDGPGVRGDEADRVFDRFYRAEPLARTTAPGSAGLGLAIASAIADAHGGLLELDTGPGQGCTFRLLLPDPAGASAKGPEVGDLTAPRAARPTASGPVPASGRWAAVRALSRRGRGPTSGSAAATDRRGDG